MATGTNIADEVRLMLNDNDSGNYRWGDAEILLYINASQKEIVTLVPESNIVRTQETIAAGSGSRQTIPARGVKFLDVSNYDAVADEPGPPIRKVEKDVLDSFMPEWNYESEQGTYWTWPSTETEFTDVRFESYHHDDRQPKQYFLFPPADGASTFDVLVTYSQVPPDLASLGDTYGLDDIYFNAAVGYVAYRCMLKDGRYGSDPTARREAYHSFLRMLGLKVESDQRMEPVHAPDNANG